MWLRLRRTLGLWLLQDDVAAAKAPPMAAPVVMAMQDAGNENVQKAQGTSGPVHLSMTGVGSGNTQVASAEEVTIQIPPQSPPGPVTHMTTHVHNHHYYGAAPAIEPIRQPPAAASQPKLAPALQSPQPPTKIVTTKEQRHLLELMEPLDKKTRIKVLDFMRSQFQTGMVRELDSSGVYRTRKFVEKVLSDREQQRA